MPAVPSMAYQAQVGAATSGLTATELYEFVNESIGSERQILETGGLRGTRERSMERLRQGIIAPGGQLVLDPTPSELRKWLPRILGGAETSGAGFFTYNVTDLLTTNGTFSLLVNRQAQIWGYSGCQVDKAVFSGSYGSILRMTLDIEALTETTSGTSMGSATITGEQPFTFFDSSGNGSFTLAGTVFQAHSITLTIDNMLKKDRFVNSQTRTDLPPTDRIITLDAVVPYTSDTATTLYDIATTSGNVMVGVTADVRFSYLGVGDGAAGVSLHFILGNVVLPAHKSPIVPNRDEITMTIKGMVRRAGTSLSCQAKLDVVP